MNIDDLIEILGPHGLRVQTKANRHNRDVQYQYWFEGYWVANRLTEVRRGKRVTVWEHLHKNEVAKLVDRFPELRAAV